MRTGYESQARFPHLGACLRCRTSWGQVKGHATRITEETGMFPLCELCWMDLTPSLRLPFYRVLFEQWVWDGGSHMDWKDIEAAILSEG